MWLVLVACSAPPVVSAPVDPPLDVRLFVPGVVAVRDLPAGTVIVAEDLTVGGVPEFTPSPVLDPGPVVGSTVREPILAGEPFRVERTVPGEGYPALVEAGVASALSVPLAAAIGLGPGCVVEVVAVDDPSRRPRLVVPGGVRVLGLEPGGDGMVTVMVESPSGIGAEPVTVVVLPLRAEEENPTEPVFEAPLRPGRLVAVARHPLLAGVFVRSEDLGEVGGVGLRGLDLPEVWARTPHQRILAGEVVRAERIATDTTGLCVKVPDGMRAVGVRAEPGTVGPDLVDVQVSIRVNGHEIRGLYVLAVDAAADVVTVAAGPDIARAIAVVGATSGVPFGVTQ